MRLFRLLPLAVCIALACSTAPLGSDAGPPCTPACQSGLVCQANRCIPQQCGGDASCPTSLSCVAGFCTSVGCDPQCPPQQVCLDSVCIAKQPTACSPSTACTAPQTCVDGYCVDTSCDPSCDSGSVCLGGFCVPQSGDTSCAAPFTACLADTLAYCVDLAIDSSNCGACGNTCPSGELCAAGNCVVSCLVSELSCTTGAGTLCIDPQSDNQNCGTCGNICPSGQACSGGSCAATCLAPYSLCGAAGSPYCAELQTDSFNCGTCGYRCASDQPCVGGVCGSGGTLTASATASTTAAASASATASTTAAASASATASTTAAASASATASGAAASATSGAATATGGPSASASSGATSSNGAAGSSTASSSGGGTTGSAFAALVTDPPNGTTVFGDVRIEATATPAVGRTITNVEFVANGTVLGSAHGSPYSLTVPLDAGSWSVEATATDDQSNTVTSQAVAFTVVPTPLVALAGDPVAGTEDDNPGEINTNGNAEAYSCTAADSGVANHIYFLSSAINTAINGFVGIYSNAGANPDALLASAGPFAVATGNWNVMTLSSPVNITQGTTYWLAGLGPYADAGILYWKRDTNSTANDEFSGNSYVETQLPTTWAAYPPNTYDLEKVSLFVGP